MSIAARVTVTGLDKVGGAVRRMEQLGASPRPLWNAFGQYGESSTRLRFQTQAGPSGAKWRPSQRVKKHGGQTLVLKRRLERSITYRANNSGVEWGSNVVYARIHQLGGKIQKLAFSSTLRLRTNRSGALLRQADRPNLAVFARAHHKQAVTRRYTVGAHTINMPARPYLGVNAADVREMRAIGGEVIGNAVRAAGSN
ncbi:phage virion morphogenesis protein [Variovorax gossypii]